MKGFIKQHFCFLLLTISLSNCVRMCLFVGGNGLLVSNMCLIFSLMHRCVCILTLEVLLASSSS